MGLKLDVASMPWWLLALIALVNISALIVSIAKIFTIIGSGQKKNDQNSAPRIIVQQRNISSSVRGQKIPSWVLFLMATVALELTYFAVEIFFLHPPPGEPLAYALLFASGGAVAALSALAVLLHNRRLNRW